MGKFLVTLFFGWTGIHKFIEKKNVIGFVYLFTLGLFGIGWLIDVIKAAQLISHSKQSEKIDNTNPVLQPNNKNSGFDFENEYEEVEDPNRINFSVAGVTFNNEDGTSRQQILKTFYEKRGYSKKDIQLQPHNYQGESAIYVIAKGNIIGNVPREHVQAILDNIDSIRIYHFRVKMNNKGIYYSVIDLFLK